MLPDKRDVTVEECIAMLLLLNEEHMLAGTATGASVAKAIGVFAGDLGPATLLEGMYDRDLITFRRNGKLLHEFADDAQLSLTHTGFAFLINYAEDIIERIRATYGEIPDNSVTSLVRYLDLKRVPAADRHVKTTDNLPAFKTLEESLEAIRLEIVRDYNSRHLALEDPRAVIADIDSVLSQIRSGYVRLSDLTQKVRPLPKELASACKDVVVIATAVTSGIAAVEAILQRIF